MNPIYFLIKCTQSYDTHFNSKDVPDMHNLGLIAYLKNGKVFSQYIFKYYMIKQMFFLSLH